MPDLRLAQDPAADELLSRDPFALLVGMLLDQQYPMEAAFAGPYLISQRLGSPGRLNPAQIAEADPVRFAAQLAQRPAVHRYPGSMAGRVQALARVVMEQYGGDPAAIWRGAGSGEELLGRLQALPGYGRQKAQIFLALLGKQLDVRPAGWREAAGAYGEEGSARSVADVTGPDSLARVRETKRAARATRRDSG